MPCNVYEGISTLCYCDGSCSEPEYIRNAIRRNGPPRWDTGGRRRRLCPFCKEREATLLCDFVVDYAADGRRYVTCDNEICETCAVRVAGAFDFCPVYAKLYAELRSGWKRVF